MNIAQYTVIVVSLFALFAIYQQITPPSLMLNTVNGLLFCLVSACIAVAIIYIFKRPSLRDTKDWLLFMIRLIHYVVVIYATCYLFIFSPADDMIFIVFYLALSTHWLFFKGECILSLWEKQIMDPSYKVGDAMFTHPWLQLIFGDALDYFMVGVSLLMLFNIATVIHRTFRSFYLKWLLIMCVFAMNVYFNIQRVKSANE